MIVAGVDIDAKGALVLAEGDRRVEEHALPVEDLEALTALARLAYDRGARVVYVESHLVLPIQGRRGIATQSARHERVRIALRSAGLRIVDVDPVTWQRACGIHKRRARPGETRSQVRSETKRTIAQVAAMRTGRTWRNADAVLIALYGWSVERMHSAMTQSPR